MSDITVAAPVNAHAWEREKHEHYVEPHWCSERMFAEEKFDGPVWDPCCGFGRIPDAARRAGLEVVGSDVVDRGWAFFAGIFDFLSDDLPFGFSGGDIVCNPPFKIVPQFAARALSISDVGKVAMIFPTARLNASHWIHNTPLARVWLMTPRPSMPPGHTIAAGEKPGGGKMDFCWLVWERGHVGAPVMQWLRRDV